MRGLKLNKMVRFSSLFVLALFLCGAVCSLPLQGMGHNGKVAVMADSRWNWANGWPETDYLSVLRETVSALDYLGYRYDLINETIAQDALNSYAMVISIAGRCVIRDSLTTVSTKIPPRRVLRPVSFGSLPITVWPEFPAIITGTV